MTGWLKAIVPALLAVFLLASCGKPSEGGETTVILVSAAASLRDSLEPIGERYQHEHPGIRIEFNYGSSGTLQKQIEQGVRADLFLSAGRKQMDVLTEKKWVVRSQEVLANQLVLVVRSDYQGAVKDVQALSDSDIRKVAMGQPDTVPAGSYSRQALISLGLWDKLQSKLVYGQDVRQVLAFVETGNADAGLVYRTDVKVSSKVKLAYELPDEGHDPIVYPFGLLNDSRNPEKAFDFYLYLTSESALAEFRKNGFRQP